MAHSTRDLTVSRIALTVTGVLLIVGLPVAVFLPNILDIWQEMSKKRSAPAVIATSVPAENTLADLKEWPNPAPPPAPKVARIPFPEFDENWTDGPPEMDPATGASITAQRRLSWLLQRHPSPEIRETLLGMKERHQGDLSLQPMRNTTVAMFFVMSIERARSIVPESMPDKTGVFPLFVINERRIDSITSQREAKVVATFMFHEWQHYEQHKDAVAHGRKEEAQTFLQKPAALLSTEECTHHWNHEHDAWRKTCLFAYQIGIDDYFSRICPWVGDAAAFRQAVFNYSPTHVMIGDGIGLECVPVNARLAGHRNPELFGKEPN